MFERFRTDERAIEGLPIRLVIALVVGVASLSVMMNTLSGITALGVSELDVRPSPEVVAPGSQSVTVTVVDADGRPISNATVVAQAGTADLDNVQTATTGPNGEASLSLTTGLGSNQAEGTITLDVKPPAGGQYTDKRGNTKILVVEGAGSGGSS